jgi:Na+-transporting NADH:ubiquinone oxidoreductase subunit A
MRVQDVIALGRLFKTGELRREAVIAITGNEVKTPQYVSTYPGASIAELTQGNVTDSKLRFISGDVLSGKQVDANGFMNERDDQLTVIEEGDFYEMFGWLLPLSPRPSASGTYPNGLFPNMKFDVNTNTHGEKRAFVVTGQYEEVLPMDIYPQHLFKSILTKDVEMMEGLGINELSEEDVALCEFVCTSKQPLQQLLREGLDYMRTEA